MSFSFRVTKKNPKPIKKCIQFLQYFKLEISKYKLHKKQRLTIFKPINRLKLNLCRNPTKSSQCKQQINDL